MPQLDSYLFFNGTCAEAMNFYHRTLGGEMQRMLTYGEGPEPHACTEADKHRVMHACLVLDGRLLMASDTPSDRPSPPMAAFSLSLSYPTADEARRVFGVLAEGGRVEMPLAETFWVELFGACVDRYGTSWMIGGGRQKM